MGGVTSWWGGVGLAIELPHERVDGAVKNGVGTVFCAGDDATVGTVAAECDCLGCGGFVVDKKAFIPPAEGYLYQAWVDGLGEGEGEFVNHFFTGEPGGEICGWLKGHGFAACGEVLKVAVVGQVIESIAAYFGSGGFVQGFDFGFADIAEHGAGEVFIKGPALFECDDLRFLVDDVDLVVHPYMRVG